LVQSFGVAKVFKDNVRYHRSLISILHHGQRLMMLMMDLVFGWLSYHCRRVVLVLRISIEMVACSSRVQTTRPCTCTTRYLARKYLHANTNASEHERDR